MCSFGAGIGSALFTHGLLVPDAEFGHIEIRGKDAEKHGLGAGQEEHALGLGAVGGPELSGSQ